MQELSRCVAKVVAAQDEHGAFRRIQSHEYFRHHCNNIKRPITKVAAEQGCHRPKTLELGPIGRAVVAFALAADERHALVLADGLAVDAFAIKIGAPQCDESS